MEIENYYEILGVPVDAPTEEIEKAIHQQFREWNHRLNAPSLERRQLAEKMLEKLEMMERILLDEEMRKQYDQELKEIQREESIYEKVVKRLSGGRTPSASKDEPEPSDRQEKEEEKNARSIGWIKQRRWVFSVFAVLFIGILSIVSWNLFLDRETPVKETQAKESQAQSKIDPVQTKSEVTKSENLVEEIKKYASQGKAYGVPFGIGASVEEVKAAWGEPQSGKLAEGGENYYPGKYISLDICEQKVCRIVVTRMWYEPDYTAYSLPPRYESLTFDQVKKVLGDNYLQDGGQYEEIIYKLSNYELTFAVANDNEKGKIINFSVSKSSSSQITSPSTEQMQTATTENNDLLSEIWQLGLQGDEQGIQTIVNQKSAILQNITMSQVKATWGEPTKEEPQRNGYTDLFYDNGTNTLSITIKPDKKIENISFTKGIYILSEIWNSASLGKVYGVPFSIGTQKSVIDEEWGEGSITQEELLIYDGKASFGLDSDERIGTIVLYHNNMSEEMKKITRDQVVAAWGEPPKEEKGIFGSNIYYFSGLNVLEILFTPDGAINTIVLSNVMDLGDD